MRIESHTEPPAWFRYRADEHRLVKTAMVKTAPADMRDVEVVRDACVSKDGARVPMSILRRTGMKLDGTNPTLLTGYGGFGVSRKPRLRNWYRAWLDAGRARRSGEPSRRRRDGRVVAHRRQASPEAERVRRLLRVRADPSWLSNYTAPGQAAIWGRQQNGGSLDGRSARPAPEAYRAVVAGVGTYDMLRTEPHRTAPST